MTKDISNSKENYIFDDYIAAIEKCKVYEVACVSVLQPTNYLSHRFGQRIFLKREDQQSVFSFKLRGAYNKIALLSDRQKQAGIVAASAGNHAQGVALSARKLGVNASIVMPLTTPPIKVKAVALFNPNILRYGDTYDEAYGYAVEFAKQNNHIFVHPYDDPQVIAGQGSIGKEIHEQCRQPIDAVFVPVGGGGLIAGVAVYLKKFRPQTKIIGVEPSDAPTLYTALQRGQATTLDKVGLFSDGTAVRRVGDETFRIAKALVDEVVLVSTDEICAAIKDNFDENRTLLEPAGALSIAGMKNYIEHHRCTDNVLVAIISGANINFDRLKHVVERYEIGAGSESLLSVTIPERPGSFVEFCRTIGKQKLTEFNYRYSDKAEARVFVGLEFENPQSDKPQTIAALLDKGYEVIDLSDNEMAKLHIRHMVGGHLNDNRRNEQLCRFQFPERPGALLEFLEYFATQDLNISLFHYSNHGAEYGRILAGVQVPKNKIGEFKKAMQQSRYQYQDESGNPAYQLFLR
ncbi:MAG: threonine ammonia-lyase, biosynthetic [Chromatiales bacterium]|nr:threonine ammonia-lyase, biosynthetic [Chromatiales bacterium]